MAAFTSVLGQQSAVQTLRHALAHGRVHHAYRFEGPPGVGKELAAFELARALLCDAPAESRACGACDTCRRVSTFSKEAPVVPLHPDVVLVARGLYPPSALGRDRPETSAISVDQIRSVVLPRVGYPPHQGRALVIIVRDADEMTVSAANALLKTLEEPHAETHFVLLSSKPERLLDTIRSRTLPVRFGPLPRAIVEEILARHDAPRELAGIAEGSASLALSLAISEEREQQQAFVQSALRAIEAPDLASGLEQIEAPGTSRDELGRQLGFLAQALAERARSTVGSDDREALRCARRYFHVLEASQHLERNAQPALVLESLVHQLQAVLA